MREKIHNFYKGAYDWLASSTFLVLSLLYFVAHSLWVVLSSNLLPYDEYYHVAIIKQYALQWSPFVTSQPTEGVFYGDITRLHSYAYHWLMSYPYRLFDRFVESETILIILMRLINVALVVGGILLFRRLFLEAGIPKRLVHFVIAMFVATPFVVILASQNNYDNFMFFLCPIFFTFAYRLVRRSGASVVDIMWYASIGLFAALVKHSFALVFIITTLYVVYKLYKKGILNFLRKVASSVKHVRRGALILAGFALLFTSVLFIERHGLNLYRYGSINVNCVSVQSQELCDLYSPWRRNNLIRQNPPSFDLYGNPISFTQHWLATMMSGLYAIFANIVPERIEGPDPYGHYVFRPLLWLPVKIAYGVLVLTVFCLVKYRSKIQKNQLLAMFSFIAGGLLLLLFAFNYRTYLTLGRAYAIQVRYTLPVLLPIFLISAYAIQQLFKAGSVKKYISITILAGYMIGGGAVGWIIRSDQSWYWRNETVTSVNQRAQTVLERFVPN